MSNSRRHHTTGETLNELALFAGAGGGILGGKLLGWRTVCAVEIEPYPRKILMQRQDDGILDPFPIWDDVRTFDGRPWRGIIDVVSGGFPCQDISSAGKGAGITGERSGLWSEFARIICEVRPRYVFVENSPVLTSRGLGTVLGDLASLGYDAEWGVLGAADAIHANGIAPIDHSRFRIWIVAKSSNAMFIRSQARQLQNRKENKGRTADHVASCSYWASEPELGRVADGVANRVDRLKAIGNGQVPAVAASAWELLK